MPKKSSSKKRSKDLTTYERLTQNPERKAKIERKYRELLLAELMLAFIEEDYAAVKKLAKAVGITPSVINDICSREEKDITLRCFSHIAATLGYGLALEKLPMPSRRS
jgi:hypothetical protein